MLTGYSEETLLFFFLALDLPVCPLDFVDCGSYCRRWLDLPMKIKSIDAHLLNSFLSGWCMFQSYRPKLEINVQERDQTDSVTRPWLYKNLANRLQCLYSVHVISCRSVCLFDQGQCRAKSKQDQAFASAEFTHNPTCSTLSGGRICLYSGSQPLWNKNRKKLLVSLIHCFVPSNPAPSLC